MTDLPVFTPPSANLYKEIPLEWILDYLTGNEFDGLTVSREDDGAIEPSYALTFPSGAKVSGTIVYLNEIAAEWATEVDTEFSRSLLAEAEGQFFRDHERLLTAANISGLLHGIVYFAPRRQP